MHLPAELLELIFAFSDPASLLTCSLVSKEWLVCCRTGALAAPLKIWPYKESFFPIFDAPHSTLPTHITCVRIDMDEASIDESYESSLAEGVFGAILPIRSRLRELHASFSARGSKVVEGWIEKMAVEAKILVFKHAVLPRDFKRVMRTISASTKLEVLQLVDHHINWDRTEFDQNDLPAPSNLHTIRIVGQDEPHGAPTLFVPLLQWLTSSALTTLELNVYLGESLIECLYEVAETSPIQYLTIRAPYSAFLDMRRFPDLIEMKLAFRSLYTEHLPFILASCAEAKSLKIIHIWTMPGYTSDAKVAMRLTVVLDQHFAQYLPMIRARVSLILYVIFEDFEERAWLPESRNLFQQVVIKRGICNENKVYTDYLQEPVL